MDARIYWDQHYTTHPFANGKEPNPLLKRMLPRLRRGHVLDIAMGEGQNAVFLGQQGNTVEGIDISQVAVDRTLALAHEHNITVQVRRTDLDMYLFKLLAYDTIVMIDFRPALTRYYSELARALKHGGTLLIEGALSDGTYDPNVPHATGFKSNELLTHLRGMKILYYEEVEDGKNSRIACLAEKPAHQDAEKLGIFDMHSKDKKHKEESIHLQMAESLFKK